MGQYFIFVNPDKKEYIVPDNGVKLWEIAVNFTSSGILAYLLADGEKDGTGLLTHTNDEKVKDQLIANGWKVFKEDELPYSGKYWLLEMDTKYFGRWSGDRIVVAGDYGNTKLYEIAQEQYKNITEEAYEEFYKFIGEDFAKRNKGYLRPDYVVVSNGVGNPPTAVRNPIVGGD